MGELLPFTRPEADEPWKTRAEVARHFSRSTRTVKRWQDAGCPHLPASQPLYRLSAVEEWLRGAQT